MTLASRRARLEQGQQTVDEAACYQVLVDEQWVELVRPFLPGTTWLGLARSQQPLELSVLDRAGEKVQLRLRSGRVTSYRIVCGEDIPMLVEGLRVSGKVEVASA